MKDKVGFLHRTVKQDLAPRQDNASRFLSSRMVVKGVPPRWTSEMFG